MVQFNRTTKRRSFKRLNVYEREKIAALLAEEKSFRYIAIQLGRNVSIIPKNINELWAKV